MKTLKIERFEAHSLILEAGTDYQPNELVPDGFAPSLSCLPATKLQALAEAAGFDKWSWTGTEGINAEFGEEKRGIKVTFVKFL